MVYLQFYVKTDRYIIDTRHIISVIPLIRIHKAAGFAGCASRYLRGYISYQDQTIPVVDLNKLLSGEESKPYLSTRIVLTSYQLDNSHHQLVGFMVEKATEVIKLNEENFSSNVVDSVAQVGSEPYLGPHAKNSDGLMQQLNIYKLIELKVLDCLQERVKVRE